jgi:hypothetical protein
MFGKRLVLVSKESTGMGSAVVVAEATGAGGFGSIAGAGEVFKATAAPAVDDELDEAGLAEAERRPRSSVAEADGPKSANNMAHAMASLTSLPLT